MVQRAGRVLLVLAVVWAAACTRAREPIAIEGSTVTVENQTDREWHDVRITVNDHFRGAAPRLAARGRLTAPLTQLQTGFGQRFSLQTQRVFKVEVTATDAAGNPVSLRWGGDKR
jgi:hypothetical protein